VRAHRLGLVGVVSVTFCTLELGLRLTPGLWELRERQDDVGTMTAEGLGWQAWRPLPGTG